MSGSQTRIADLPRATTPELTAVVPADQSAGTQGLTVQQIIQAQAQLPTVATLPSGASVIVIPASGSPQLLPASALTSAASSSTGGTTTPTVPAATLVGPVTARLAPSQAVLLPGIVYTGAASVGSYTVTASCTAGTLSGTTPNGPFVGSGTKSVSITVPYASLAATLRALVYTSPASGTDTIAIAVKAGGPAAQSLALAVTVAAPSGNITNVAGPKGYPNVAFPTTLSATAGTAVAVAGAGLADAPATAGGGIGLLAVTATNGTVVMAPNGVPVSGSGTASIVIQDTVRNCFAALMSLRFTGSAAGSGSVAICYRDSLGEVSPVAEVAVTVAAGSGGGTTTTTGTPPSDPGIAVPALTIAPSASHTFTNITWRDSQGATNTGQGAIAFSCTSGSLAVTLSGSCTARVNGVKGTTGGPTSGTSITIDGTYQDLQTLLTTLTYTAGSSAGTDSVVVDCFSGFGVEAKGTIAVTITAGATTAETGGYYSGGTSTSGTGGTTTTTGGGGGSQSSAGQAYRISLLERFGVNTFSMYEAFVSYAPPNGVNTWGNIASSNYRQDSVAACINWICGSSGLGMRGREYHRPAMADGTPYNQYQGPWLQYVSAHSPLIGWTISPGSQETGACITDMIALAKQVNGNAAGIIERLEGSLEPNNQGGFYVDPATVVSMQQALYSGGASLPGVMILGPSPIYAAPYAESSWVIDYIVPQNNYGLATFTLAQANQINAALEGWNIHTYPARNADQDDGSARQGGIGDPTVAADKVWPTNKPRICTEWHPTMYNQDGHNFDPAYDAYYGILGLLSFLTNFNFQGVYWYALLDYDKGALAGGIFADDVNSPKLIAYSLRALWQLTGDSGSNKYGFTPGNLSYTASGLPGPINSLSPYTGGFTRMFEASDGRYFLIVGNSQAAPGGSATPVTITFGQTLGRIVDYDLTSDPVNAMTALQTVTNATSITVQLKAAVHVLVITP